MGAAAPEIGVIVASAPLTDDAALEEWCAEHPGAVDHPALLVIVQRQGGEQ